jgi:hypothetical protein
MHPKVQEMLRRQDKAAPASPTIKLFPMLFKAVRSELSMDTLCSDSGRNEERGYDVERVDVDGSGDMVATDKYDSRHMTIRAIQFAINMDNRANELCQRIYQKPGKIFFAELESVNAEDQRC